MWHNGATQGPVTAIIAFATVAAAHSKAPFINGIAPAIPALALPLGFGFCAEVAGSAS